MKFESNDFKKGVGSPTSFLSELLLDRVKGKKKKGITTLNIVNFSFYLSDILSILRHRFHNTQASPQK